MTQNQPTVETIQIQLTELAEIHPEVTDYAAWTTVQETLKTLTGEMTRDEYRAIFDNLPIGIFQTTVEGKYLQANPALAQIYGYDSPTQLINELTDIANQLYVDPERRAEFINQLNKQERLSNFEAEAKRRDGSTTWIAESGRAVRNDEDEILYYEGIVEDINRRKELEQLLLQWNNENEQLLRERQAAEAEKAQLLKESEYRSERLQIASEVARAASSITEVETLMERSVNLIRDRFDFYYVGIFMVENNWAVLKAGTGQAGEEQLAKNHRLKLGDGSMIGWSVENRQARIALDVGEDAVHFKNPHLPETRSEMALPLISRGRALGALTVQSIEERAFSDEDITLLQTMADQLAVAIENAQLLEQTQTALEETSSLYEISQSLVKADSAEEIYEMVIDTIRAYGVDRVSISLLDRSESGHIETVTIAANWDRDPEQRGAVGTKFSADSFSLVHTFAKPPFSPLVSEDMSTPEGQDERMDEAFRQYVHQEMGSITMFSAPMFLGSEYKGVLSIHTRRPHHYNQGELRVYQTLADQAIIAIENRRLLAETRMERDRAALLYELGQNLSQATNIKQVLQQSIHLGKQLQIRHQEIYLTDEQTLLTLESTLPERENIDLSTEQTITQTVLSTSLEAQALRRQEVVIQEKVPPLPGVADRPTVADLAVACIPFRAQRSPLKGVLSFFGKKEEHVFNEDNLATLESMAILIAGAVENVWLLEQSQTALQETELLYEATRNFNAAQNVEDLVHTLVKQFALQADGTPTALDLIALGRFISPDEEEDRSMELLASWLREKKDVQQSMLLLPHKDHRFLGQFHSELPVQLNTNQISLDEESDLESIFGKMESIVGIPLRVGQQWLGLLFLGTNHAQQGLSPHLVPQVMALSGQVAVLIQNLQLVAGTRHNLHRTETLSQLSQELLSANTREAIYEACLRAVGHTEPQRGALIMMPNEDNNELILTALWNTPGTEWPTLKMGSRFRIADYPFNRWIAGGEPLIVENVAEAEMFDELLKERLHLMRMSSIAVIPMTLKQSANGFILIGHPKPTTPVFPPETIQLFVEISRRTAEALEYQRVLEAAQYRATLLETTADISSTVTGSVALDQLLPDTVALIQRRLGYYHVALFLVDDYNQYAIIKAATGDVGRQLVALRHKLSVGGATPVGTAITTGEVDLVRELGPETPHFSNPLLPETRAELALPLTARGQIIGALDVQSREPHAFTEGDITILQSMASQVANAIESAQALEESQRSLAEVNRLHEHYLRKTWRGFLRERQASMGYLMDQTEEVAFQPLTTNHLLVDNVPQEDLAALWERQSLWMEQGLNGDNGDEEGTSLLAPLTLHGQAVIGAIGLEVAERELIESDDTWQIVEAVASQAAQAIESARLIEETQAAREEAEALYRLGRTLVTNDDIRQMYETALRELLTALGVSQGRVLLFEADETQASVVVQFEENQSVSPQPEQLQWSLYERLRNERRPLNAVINRQETIWQLVFPELEEGHAPEPEPIAEPPPLNEDVTSILLIPIITDARVSGVVQAEVQEQIYSFSEREFNVAGAVIDQLTIMLQNRHLLEETRRRAIQLQTSADVSRVATSILDPEPMLAQAVELIRERFGYYHAQIFLIDDLEEYAVLDQSTGEIGQELLALNHKVAIGSSNIIGQVTDLRQSLVVRRDENDTTRLVGPNIPELFQDKNGANNGKGRRRRVDAISGDFVGPEIRTELAVPLQVGQKLVGILDVQSTENELFTKEDIATLESLGSQLAVALQNARAFKAQQETAARLREVDKLKTQFLANMSHELRTPLNSIIGFSRVILKGIDGPLTELQKADLTSIHNSGQHLLGLINNILDLSKIEAGKMELNPEEVEMEPILKQVMSTALALVKDKPVKLITEVEPDIPIVWADPTRIRQVVLNLVSNACKFTENGTVTLRASANEDKVTVSVTDTGIGIPKENLGNVFEEFTQVDASTTRKVGGTGLGLPISRHFIEMHKGQIWVESDAGQGSIFSFAIPIEPVENTDLVSDEEYDAEAKEKHIDKQVENISSSDEKKTIVAIDDDAGVVALYRRFLEPAGYEVIGINDTENVVARVKHYAPNAILLDVLIPNKDGWTVLRELKDNSVTKAIPVIICSIISDKNRGFSLGASDYLVKPIVENELIRALKNLEAQAEEQTKVLVIDDHADDILLVRRILEAQDNYNVIEAENGREGLKLVESMRPDLIILDLSMPEMNGFEVVERLKSNKKTQSIPIIVISAQELSNEEYEFLTEQVTVLRKKGIFTEQELLADVAQALKHEQPTSY